MSWGLEACHDLMAESGAETALDQPSIDYFLPKVRMHLSLTFHRFTMPRKETWMSSASEHAGLAALSICEALLLAMNDRGLLPEHEIVGILRDAAATHENAVGPDAEMENHRAVAELINAIIAGGNSVRRP